MFKDLYCLKIQVQLIIAIHYGDLVYITLQKRLNHKSINHRRMDAQKKKSLLTTAYIETSRDIINHIIVLLMLCLMDICRKGKKNVWLHSIST